MERTADIILAEIKEYLQKIEQSVAELESLAPAALEEVPSEPVDLDIDLPEEAQPEPAPEPLPEPVPEPEPEEEMPPQGPAIIDVVTRKRAWEIDIPGAPVGNILSAISLNDRLLFINSLFKKDPVLFQDTIRRFNGMADLAAAEDYIQQNFPDWNLESDTVYRFMMAVRRKLS
ncbi:MAG: hypothetical protein IKI70_06625 [Bacteroidales bacterium]|nr:hypothetical protein [Bacteroidales bacterium]